MLFLGRKSIFLLRRSHCSLGFHVKDHSTLRIWSHFRSFRSLLLTLILLFYFCFLVIQLKWSLVCQHKLIRKRVICTHWSSFLSILACPHFLAWQSANVWFHFSCPIFRHAIEHFSWINMSRRCFYERAAFSLHTHFKRTWNSSFCVKTTVSTSQRLHCLFSKFILVVLVFIIGGIVWPVPKNHNLIPILSVIAR